MCDLEADIRWHAYWTSSNRRQPTVGEATLIAGMMAFGP
jgi:hypothetical protein